jgi:hypothetical protein
MDSNLCMLRYYKKHIIILKGMLDSIEPSSDDFEPLLDIQEYILERILQTEGRIKLKKAGLNKLKKSLRTRNNDKTRSNEIKLRKSKIQDTIKGYQFLLYVWRCFGDGIVFKYISKWNLKRLLFEADSPEIKQTPGYIGGKKGIMLEWHLVKSAAQHNVPAVLCDITNSIRHGDVCLLGASDPKVIEVKSSTNKNSRVDRQVKSIGKIHDYLDNDIGSIGGIDGMRRVEFSGKEKHHNSAINEVIEALTVNKNFKLNPEIGLTYIGFVTGADPDYDSLFCGIKEPVVYMLNQAKTEMRWDNYYPFTLSLTSGESLFRFLNGEIYLIVVIDGSVLKEMSNNIGYDLDIIMSEDAGFVFSKEVDGYDKPFKSIASEHYVGRLGLEFISLEWFFEKERHLLKYIEDDLIEKTENILQNATVETDSDC